MTRSSSSSTSRAVPRSRSTTRSSTAQRPSARRRRACSRPSATVCSSSTARASIRTWNRAAAIATGLPASAVVDRLAVEAIPGWSAIASRIAVATRQAAPRRAPSRCRSIWAGASSGSPIHGVAVPDGVVYAFRDLTEERALERMRTEFVSTVSHELRTPLAAIYGAAMTLRRSDVALDDEQRDAAARHRLRRGRPARAHRQRHPLGEPPGHRHAARDDPELRPARARRRGRDGAARCTSTARIALLVDGRGRACRSSPAIPTRSAGC